MTSCSTPWTPWGNQKPKLVIEDTQCKDVTDLTTLLPLPENQRLSPLLQSYAVDRANFQDCKIKHDYQKNVNKELAK